MSEFSGYSAVVTGGSMGIGAATARALCGAGARVTVLDVQDGSELAAALPGCRFAAVDVRDPEAVTRAIDAAADAQDGLDGLVNNAGIGRARLLDATHAEGWDELIDINLKGAFNCTKAAVPHLRARGGGGIVNLASVAGKNISLGADVPYTVSKWGMVGFTRHLAYELAPWGIRVNAVFPGPTRTRLVGGGDARPGGAQEKIRERGSARAPDRARGDRERHLVLPFAAGGHVHRRRARRGRWNPARFRQCLRRLLPESGRGAAPSPRWIARPGAERSTGSSRP